MRRAYSPATVWLKLSSETKLLSEISLRDSQESRPRTAFSTAAKEQSQRIRTRWRQSHQIRTRRRQNRVSGSEPDGDGDRVSGSEPDGDRVSGSEPDGDGDRTESADQNQMETETESADQNQTETETEQSQRIRTRRTETEQSQRIRTRRRHTHTHRDTLGLQQLIDKIDYYRL